MRAAVRRRRARRWATLWTGLFLLFLVAFLYQRSLDSQQATALLPFMPDPATALALEVPDAGALADASLPPILTGPARTVEGALGVDERFIEILDSLDLARAEIYPAVAAMEKMFSFRKLRPRTRYAIDLDSDGTLRGFRLHISPLEVYSVERRKGGYGATKMAVALRREEIAVSGEIRTSLSQAIRDSGEHPSLLAFVVDVFEWDIDFNSATRAGDRFAIVAEKLFVDDRFVRYGELRATAYEGEVAGRHLAIAWGDGDGPARFYDAAGHSVKKAFLKSPLHFTRISSGFAKKRFHPILHRTRAHLGVDYAAPKGTHVRAIGDGRVSFAGWKGANGKLVSIQHPSGYKSHYAHLSTIRKGIREGAEVEQKQRIGRVGATGLATGPHLHFGVSRGDHFVNPMTIRRVPDQSVPQERRDDFYEASRPLVARLETLLQKAAAVGGWATWPQ